MKITTNSNMGCMILILISIVLITIMVFFGKLIFTTPLGIVLLGIILYGWYKKKKSTVEHVSEFHPDKFSEDDEIIDIEYEDLE